MRSCGYAARTELLDILYDFDEEQYQRVDHFQSWHLCGHAEHESSSKFLSWLICRSQAFPVLVPSIARYAFPNDTFSRRRRPLPKQLPLLDLS